MSLAAAFDVALDRLARQDYTRDPAAWARDRLGVHPWSKQAQIMSAVANRRLVAVQSAHGVGKTRLASWLVCWFLDTHPVGAKVVTSAPTAHQVKAVLWEYIREGHAAADMAGYITQAQVPEWKIGGKLAAFGRKPADHQQSAFQGQHAPWMLVILDEAGGIPKWLWDASDSLLTGEEGQHLLAIGNPDDNSSHFHTVCTTEPNWTRFKVSAFDSPNYTGETVPPNVATQLVGPAYVDDKKARWGPNSPLYQAKVLGEFVDSEDGLIPMSWVRAAHARWHAWHDAGAKEVGGRRIIGVDVARYGEDATVLALREGDVIRELKTHTKLDTTATTSLVEAELAFPRSFSVVDVIGVGAGVVDLLRSHRRSVIAFNASMATRRRDSTGQWRFPNCLTEDARVRPVGDLRRIYRAPYQGPLFEVEMASGDHFTATANHKVLTPRGWVAIQSLDVGDQLTDALRTETATAGRARPEVNDVPPPLGEVYRAAARLFGTERMDAAAVDFHGDRPVGEVDVVTVDGDLLAVDPSDRQQAQDLDLVRLLVAQRLLPPQGAPMGAVGVRGRDVRERVPLPGDGVAARMRHAGGQRPSFGAQGVGLHAGTAFDTSGVQSADDGPLVDLQVVGDALDRLPGQVPLHHGGTVQVDLPSQFDRFCGRAETLTSLHQDAADDVQVDPVLRGELVDRHASSVVGDHRLSGDVDQAPGSGSFDLAADGDPVRFQQQLDSLPVGVESAAQRRERLAAGVATDEIVGIKLRSDALHDGGSFVYTLETSSGTYNTSTVLHKNCRAASYWNLRELLDPALGATLALPEDDDLTAELTTPQWRIGTGNTLVVESKDEIRKRLGRSTDRSDAVAMACWVNTDTARSDGDDNLPRVRQPRIRRTAYAGAGGFTPPAGGISWG